jgi:hypothetical protein
MNYGEGMSETDNMMPPRELSDSRGGFTLTISSQEKKRLITKKEGRKRNAFHVCIFVGTWAEG